MKPQELLRECALRLERNENLACEHGMVLTHPRSTGKFPFAGGGSELLNQTAEGTNYWVPVHRILSGMAKALKEAQRE